MDKVHGLYAFCQIIWTLIFVGISTDAAVICSDSWIPYDGSRTCLQFFQEYLSWDESRASCQTRGGDLVKILDSAMNDFITETFEDVGTAAWIGLNDLYDEQTFMWLDEKTEAEYTCWASREPDKGSTGESYDCVYTALYEGGLWHDYDCNYAIGMMYICERSPVITTVSLPPEITSRLPKTAAASQTPVPKRLTTNLPADQQESDSGTDPFASYDDLGIGAAFAITGGCVIIVLIGLLAAYFGVKYYRNNYHVHLDTVAFVAQEGVHSASVEMNI